MNQRHALLVSGVAAILVALGAAQANGDTQCFEGTWRGKAVENLPSGSELMGGKTVIEEWARDMVLEVHGDRLTVRHPDLQIETPMSVAWQREQRMQVRLAEPKNFFAGDRQELLFEVIGPRLLRVDLVEGQPFVFERIAGAPPTSLCGTTAKGSGDAALPQIYYGRWLFDTLPGQEDKLAQKPEMAEMLRTFEIELAPGDLTARFAGQRETKPYRKTISDRSSVTIATEHPSFKGSFGHEVSLKLELPDQDVLRVRVLGGSAQTFQFKRAGAEAPAAPARKQATDAGGGNPYDVVPCDENGKVVFKHRYRCRKLASGG